MLIRYRIARGAGQSVLHSLAFALFKQSPTEIQLQTDAQLVELQKRWNESAAPNAVPVAARPNGYRRRRSDGAR